MVSSLHPLAALSYLMRQINRLPQHPPPGGGGERARGEGPAGCSRLHVILPERGERGAGTRPCRRGGQREPRTLRLRAATLKHPTRSEGPGAELGGGQKRAGGAREGAGLGAGGQSGHKGPRRGSGHPQPPHCCVRLGSPSPTWQAPAVLEAPMFGGGHSFRQEAPRVLCRQPLGASRQHPAPLPGAAGAAGLSWHGEKSGSYCAGAPLQRERRAQFISFKETQPEGIIRASLRTQSHIVYPTQIKKRGPQEHGAGEIKKRSAPRRVSLLPRRTGPLKPLCVSGQWQESRDLRSTSGLQRYTRGAVNKYGVENWVNLCASIHLSPVLSCLLLHAFGSQAHTNHVKALLEMGNRGGLCRSSGGAEGHANGVLCARPPTLQRAGAEGPCRGGASLPAPAGIGELRWTPETWREAKGEWGEAAEPHLQSPWSRSHSSIRAGLAPSLCCRRAEWGKNAIWGLT